MDLADTPTTWADPEPMSTLEALLIFVGIPLLMTAVITLLVMAPSLVRGPRYRPGQEWTAEPETFGRTPDESGGRHLTAGTARTGDAPADREPGSGGASANW